MQSVQTQRKSVKRYCTTLQDNLEKCIQKYKEPTKCDYLKKVLHMCLKRPKNVFISGP